MTDLTEYQKAMEILDDLAKEYEVWVQKDLKNLQDSYTKALQKQGVERCDVMLHEVFKIAHDMKGQGATFGYDLITDIGNHLCRYIEKQTSFENEQMQIVQKHIDALAEILEAHLKGDGAERGTELKATIEAL